MRSILLFFLVPFLSISQESLNIDLLDNWSDDSLLVNSTEKRYNDCWGFTIDGQEYAAIGSTESVHFLAISDQGKLTEVGKVNGSYQSALVVHRDIKIHDNYAYVVCDEGQSSLQIIDLTYLPDSIEVVYDSYTEFDNRFVRCHNIFIDSENEILYACNPVMWDMMLIEREFDVYSLSNPELPSLLWTGNNSLPTVHDCYVKDNVAFLNCGFNGLRVYDFTIPNAPIYIQNLDIYQEQGYNHQGWLTPNGKHYIFADETEGAKLKFCSVQNNEVTIESYFGSNDLNGSIPHNIMCSNEFAYVAYYNEGLRIFDLREMPPKEIAHYDTYPDDSEFQMNGAWGVYNDLPSGRVLVSDRTYGLFLFDFREDIFLLNQESNLTLYPNPANQNENIIIKLEEEVFSDFVAKIYTSNGKYVSEFFAGSNSYIEIKPPSASGLYHIRISYLDYLNDEISEVKKIVVN